MVSLGDNIYGNKIAFVVGAYLATFFVLWLSKLLAYCFGNNAIIQHITYLGKNSIDIVIWQFLAFRITILIQIIILRVPLKAIVAFPVYDSSGMWWLAYVITGIYGGFNVEIYFRT